MSNTIYGGSILGILDKVLGGGKGLVDQAEQETIEALDSSKEMFLIVTQALKEEVSPEVLANVRKMDKKINKEHQDVRKIIYQHLSISQGKNLFHSLVLLSVIDHVERIGDYNKNIVDIVELVPGRLDFGEYESDFDLAKKQTLELFDLTRLAFTESDEAAAKQVSKIYREISKNCKVKLREVLAQANEHDQAPSFYVAYVLMLRYIRRVGAHLETISSTITQPFHYIGYRLKNNKK